MRIAVTAAGSTLDATMDPRFGRCAYFVIVETDDMTFEAIENTNI
jgi:predicted Fe-Mo cluster-binding NifX family protein